MSELYQLPDGWEWKKLSDVCDSMQGIQLPKADQICELRDGCIRYLYISDFTADKNIIYVLDQYKNKIVNEHEYVIVNTGATAGKIFRGKRGVLSNNLFKVTNFKNINDRFFYFYYLFLYQKLISNELKQSTQPHLGHKAFNRYDIPLPSLTEQERIVQKLDALFERIDKAIALLQKNIDAADNFMNSVLNDVFSNLEQNHPSKAIKLFASVCTGVTPLKTNKTYYINGTISWITSKSTSEPYVNKADELITELALKECRLVLNPIGTLIVALYGQGKTRGQVSELLIEAATNQAVATILVDDSKCINKYLKWYFKKSYLELREKSNGGTQQNLNLSIIKNTVVPLPDDLSIQSKIVTYLDELSAQIEQVKSAQQQKMQNLLDLKSSILDQAFRGKL